MSRRKNVDFLKFALDLVDNNSALAESILFKLNEINSQQAEIASQTNETNNSGDNKTESFQQTENADSMVLEEMPLEVTKEQVTLTKQCVVTADDSA